MKWYIYDDSGDNYTKILDHNTTARIKWNDDNINVSYEESNLYETVQDLKTTSGWKVQPRLITAEEIAIITGKTGFDSTKTSSWYYLDTLDFSNKRSKYDWLYNNLNLCKTATTDYGCSIEDNNIYTGYGTAESGKTMGYWTSTTVGIANSGSLIWRMCRDSSIGYVASTDDYGIRPVITISKSIIK